MSEELEPQDPQAPIEGTEGTEEVVPSREEILAAIAGEEPEPAAADPEPAEPEYSEIEQQALEQGWNPEGAEGKRNLSAEEFLDRKPLYDRAHKQDKQIKNMQEAIDAMVQQNKSISEREYQRALADLEVKMGNAVDNMDKEAATEVSKEIAALEANKPAEETTKVEPEYDPLYLDWKDKNSWYDPDSDDYDPMKAMYTNQLTEAYAPLMKKGKPFSEVLSEVDAAVQEKFKPTNPNRGKAAAVAPSTPSTPKPKAKSLSDLGLSAEEEKIARTIIRGGVSEEDYIKMYS